MGRQRAHLLVRDAATGHEASLIALGKAAGTGRAILTDDMRLVFAVRMGEGVWWSHNALNMGRIPRTLLIAAVGRPMAQIATGTGNDERIVVDADETSMTSVSFWVDSPTIEARRVPVTRTQVLTGSLRRLYRQWRHDHVDKAWHEKADVDEVKLEMLLAACFLTLTGIIMLIVAMLFTRTQTGGWTKFAIIEVTVAGAVGQGVAMIAAGYATSAVIGWRQLIARRRAGKSR